MTLLTYVLLAFLIYLILIAPLVLGIFFLVTILKFVDIDDISSLDIIKSLIFLFLISLVLLPIFFYFAAFPFYNFVHHYHNPYINLIVLFLFIGVIFFFLYIHFKIFCLYIDKLYLTTLGKNLILYTGHVSILLVLVYFYSNIIEKISLLI